MSALSCGAIGAIIGGTIGLLIGAKIPEFVAKRYKGKIKESNILISVHTDKSDEVDIAKSIFIKAGAHDVCATCDSTAPQEIKKTLCCSI